jgi:hypothetical protein
MEPADDAAAVKPSVSITHSRTHIHVGGHVTISGKVSRTSTARTCTFSGSKAGIGTTSVDAS